METPEKVLETPKTETPPAPVEKVEQPTPEVDYKAELERVQGQLKKAEHAIIKAKQSKKEEPIEEQEEDELPDVDDVVDKAVQKGLSKIHSDLADDTIDDTLDNLASDADERKLIKFHYENSIVRSGISRASIKEDMRKAKLLANAPRYERENKELEETVRAKTTTVKTAAPGSGGGSQPEEDMRKHFTARDWSFMQQRGWNKEQIRKAIPVKKV